MTKVNLTFSFAIEGRTHQRIFAYWDGPIPLVGTTVTLPLHSINGQRLAYPEIRDLKVDYVKWSITLSDSPSDYITMAPEDVRSVNVTVFCLVL